MLRRLSFLALAVAALSSSGCYSKITAYEGNFTIAYAAPLNELENFVKPIAPGAKLDLVVFANGTSDKMVLLEATSSKPGVLRVEAVGGETLTVKGVAPGATELTIVAKDESGKRVTDKMFFHVAKPATHSLEHLCTDEPKAAYVRGSEVIVFHRLATSDKRPLIGYDYVPIAVTPASALELVSQPQTASYYEYRAAQANPNVTVQSNVDGKSISLRIVEPSDIHRATLHAPDRMLAGSAAYAFGEVHLADGTTMCSQNALTRARSLTPEVCRVTAKLEDSLDDTNRDQLAEITALKFGTCQLEMTLPELGDRGIVLRQSIEIGKVEYPGEKRSWPSWPLWTFLALAQLAGIAIFIRARRSSR